MYLAFWLGLFLLWCNCQSSIGFKNTRNDVIFKDQYCNVTCKGRPHTMCSAAYKEPQCDDFELHPIMENNFETGVIERLVNGHNGVRDRIAKRMQIPDMLEMFWDDALARMAENFLHQCKTDLKDECTTTQVVFDEPETINAFYKFNHSTAYIVQNTYQERGMFYPFRFVQTVIRSWYFEKDTMLEPTNADDYSVAKRLLGENNFTHLAYPFVYRIGCGMAMFKKTFNIVCYYYPFYRTFSNTMYYHIGDPATKCPARFPLPDDIYKGLCTTETTLFRQSGAQSEVQFHHWNILLTVFLLNVLS